MRPTNPQQVASTLYPIKDNKGHQEEFANGHRKRPLAHYKDKFPLTELLETNYQVSYSTFSQLLKEIQQQIKQNQEIYNQYLKTQELMIILKQFSKGFKSHSEAVEFSTLITDFLFFCKNKEENSSSASHTFSSKYHKQLAQKWQKIRDQSYLYNKGHLKLLNYIVKSPEKREKEYDHCFSDLRFDLSIQQTRKVAAVVKKMCKEDNRAFCYLSNYFYNSCAFLDKKFIPLQQISSKYLNVLDIISKENRPAPPVLLKPGELEAHPSYAKSKNGPQIFVNLAQLTTEAQKEQLLEDFIMNRSKEALQELDRFNHIMKYICEKNNGFSYKSEVYITDKRQKKALTRIKEKMLSEAYMQETILSALLAFVGNSFSSSSTDLVSHVNQEYSEYERKMRRLFNQIKEPLPFKVSGLLGGKCVFPSVDKINKCCSDIKEETKKRQNEGIELIEIMNRLTKSNSDIVMKILFGSTITEIHLMIDLNLEDYIFSQELDQLQRYKYFTPLTQLTILNENISIDYFTEVWAIIKNNINQDTNYKEKITFNEAQNHFMNFLYFLPIQIDIKQKHPSEIDVKRMKGEQIKLKKLRRAKASQKQTQHFAGWKGKFKQLLKNGVYLYEMKRNQEAAKDLQQAISLFQRERSFLVKQKQGSNNMIQTQEENRELNEYLKTLNYAGVNYAQMEKYQLALSKFNLKNKKQTGKISLDSASTLNNMGGVYDNMGKYAEALQCHEKCLEIQEKIEIGSIDTAHTYANIGLVYYHMRQYQNGLQYFSNALNIYEGIKGKGCIESALTLNNIGNLKREMENYSQALQYHNNCLEIMERVKGKGSNDTASPLFNIGLDYFSMGKYTQALQYYNKSLEIQERIKGKGSFGTTATLNNIGTVFKDMGKYPLAIQYYNKCLEIKETVKGKGSLDTTSALVKLGSVYKHMGDYDQALKYYNKCLEINERLKGKGHIATALSLSNLGSVYKHLRNYNEALNCYKKCLEIQEKIKGKESIQKALTLKNIGNLKKDMGKYEQALHQLSECLKIQEKIKGKGSIQTASTLSNIGLVYDSMGKYSEARQFHRQCLEIQEKTKGKGSIDTASTLSFIGLAYSHQRKYPEALQCFTTCLETQQRIKGKQSIDLASTLNDIGLTYQKLSIPQQAYKSYQRSSSILEKLPVKPPMYKNLIHNFKRLKEKMIK